MNSKKKMYKAVIIGAGRIASSFDAPKSKNVLTHAHALVKHPRVELVGMMDVDSIHGKKEAKKWKTNFYSDLELMLKATSPEIVVIATPDETHLSILLDLMKKNTPLIICEKPVVTKRSDIAKVHLAAKQSKSAVLVNFRRRFDPTINKLRNDLVRGKYGTVLSANAVYTKGILHNGVHFIDLARHLFGEVRSSNMVFRVNDLALGAPSLGGTATLERCSQFYLMNADERKYSVAEFEIFTAKKRFLFFHEGFTLMTEEVVPDPVFKGDHTLGKRKIEATGLIRSMSGLIDNAVAVLEGRETPHASLLDALRTHETCFQLLNKYSK